MFKSNESSLDRAIRIALGIVLIGVFYVTQGTVIAWVALVVGIVVLVTGIVGWCALYTLFGINTRRH